MTEAPGGAPANDLISVIIAVYNRPHLITDAVNSVLNQHDATFEIIIVNDGSTDTTGHVIDDLAAHNHLITAIHRPNGGPAAARNTGVAASNGTWITFLDSDDTMATQRLATQLHAITPITAPAVVIGKQTIEVAPGVQPPPTTLLGLKGADSSHYITGMVTSRSTFDAVGGFDEQFGLGQDLELLFRLRRLGIMIVLTDHVWTHRRILGDNLSYDDEAARQAVFRAIRANQPAGTRLHPEDPNP
jgi:glycosyltransferase involved in cell wall biosynthesis